MIVLALDTSHARGTAAVSKAGAVLGERSFGKTESHLLQIGQVVTELLRESGLTTRDIDRTALVSGPGSFTGLRIGMAFVKGLFASSPMQVVIMNSLELLALPIARRGLTAAPMIDAKKNEVYAALYSQANEASAGLAHELIVPHAAAPEDFLSGLAGVDPLADKKIVFAGSGALKYENVIREKKGSAFCFAENGFNLPSAAVLAAAAPGLEPLAPEHVPALEPLYIRSSDAELKKLREVRPHGRY